MEGCGKGRRGGIPHGDSLRTRLSRVIKLSIGVKKRTRSNNLTRQPDSKNPSSSSTFSCPSFLLLTSSTSLFTPSFLLLHVHLLHLLVYSLRPHRVFLFTLVFRPPKRYRKRMQQAEKSCIHGVTRSTIFFRCEGARIALVRPYSISPGVIWAHSPDNSLLLCSDFELHKIRTNRKIGRLAFWEPNPSARLHRSRIRRAGSP